jgi:hypothetical protein
LVHERAYPERVPPSGVGEREGRRFSFLPYVLYKLLLATAC